MGVGSRRPGPIVLRCALAIPFVVVAGGYLSVLARTLLEPDQSAEYYLVNAAITLAPLAAYGVAAVLLATARGGRAAWTVLLLCGLVLTSVGLYYALTIGGLGELFFVAPYLAAVSAGELVTMSRSRRAVLP